MQITVLLTKLQQLPGTRYLLQSLDATRFQRLNLDERHNISVWHLTFSTHKLLTPAPLKL